MPDDRGIEMASAFISLLMALYEKAEKADTPGKAVAFTALCREGLRNFCVDLTQRLNKSMSSSHKAVN